MAIRAPGVLLRPRGVPAGVDEYDSNGPSVDGPSLVLSATKASTENDAASKSLLRGSSSSSMMSWLARIPTTTMDSFNKKVAP